MFQADLFKIPASVSTITPVTRPAFLEKYRFTIRLDQALIVMIAMLVFSSVVFCMGVEKGKQFAGREIHPRYAEPAKTVLPEGQQTVIIDATQIPNPPAAVVTAAPAIEASAPTAKAEPEAPTAAVAEAAPAAAASAPAAKPDGKYTIQVVTYKSQSQAQKHIEKLATKGYQGFVIPSGKSLQVCVNAFESRSAATSLLKNLKVQNLVPQDAYVRNMPH
ncbi:MAG TPA: SPOR domain-containing protein [Verrucomicrobiae bacterium]|jgi:cell division septation protein DedD|nr:SPOR domain-containing protein [Verrucomicrobiae bacterium]